MRFPQLVSLLSALTTTLSVHAAAPKLNSMSREWVQRGAKTEITLVGENLGGVTNAVISGAAGANLLLDESKTSGSPKLGIESAAGGISTVAGSAEGRSMTLAIDVATNAVLSDREIRVISPEGVSNPLTVHFSPFREIRSGRMHSRESAQKIELPVGISGTVDTAAQSDFFRLESRKGERIIAEVYAYRTGSRLDSSVGIYDAAGKELARNEDAAGLDSILNFEIPADGEYYLEVRDFRYSGGGDFSYRMVVGVLPHVDRIFPLGGQRGHAVELTLEGSNLDAKTLKLGLAEDATLGRQDLRASSSKGLSNPFGFWVSDFPHVNEKEPNSALDQADVIKIPAAVNGKIGSKKDYDAFRFHAAAGERILFEVLAYRSGSPLDSVLILTDARGEILLQNDDNAGEDARLDYTFKSDGDYFVILEDLLGRGGNEFAYLLTAATPEPDFSVTSTRDTLAVHRGGRVPVRCEVNRMNGFDDLVIVSAEDLPSGVHADPLSLPPGQSAGYLMINADADARLGSFPIQVSSRSKLGKREAEILSGDKRCLEAFLTVVPSAPFSILPITLMTAIDQNQTGVVDVMVDRTRGFEGEIKISAEGFSSGREPITRSFEVQPLVLKQGQARGSLSLKAKTDSEIGVRAIYLRGEAPDGSVAFSPLIPAAATPIPFVLSTSLKKLAVTALPSGSTSAAAEAAFTAKIERRDGFDGEVELKLDGLPTGISLTLTNIAAKASESTIKLVATEKAPAGTNLTLTLSAVAQHKDRIYRFSAPSLSLTINRPEADEKSDPKLANTQ